MRSHGINRRALSLDYVKIPINKTRLKIAALKWHPGLPGANELNSILAKSCLSVTYFAVAYLFWNFKQNSPDSKVHGASMGPIWGRQECLTLCNVSKRLHTWNGCHGQTGFREIWVEDSDAYVYPIVQRKLRASHKNWKSLTNIISASKSEINSRKSDTGFSDREVYLIWNHLTQTCPVSIN